MGVVLGGICERAFVASKISTFAHPQFRQVWQQGPQAAQKVDALAAWFQPAHAIQILAMTCVSSRQDWDGVAMLCVMAVLELTKWRWGRDVVAKQWLQSEGTVATTKIFDFEGRTPMILAI